MSTETTTTAASATTKAGRKAIDAVVAASETLPTVVEVAEIGVTVPSKLVLNQKVIVIVTAVAASSLGAAGFWGFTKLRTAKELRDAKKEFNKEFNNDVSGS